MKTGPYAVIYAIVSNLAIGLCFLPMLSLFWRKMRQDRVYILISLYWLANGLVNSPSLTICSTFESKALREQLVFVYSLLDTPLIMMIFFFASTGKKRRIILLTTLLFIAFESVFLYKNGYNYASTTILIGISLSLVLLFSVAGIVEYMIKIEHDYFETSMVFIYAALLFAYGGFIIIYVFSQLLEFKSDNTDSLLLYYVSLSLSALITCIGLWGYGIRRPQLADSY